MIGFDRKPEILSAQVRLLYEQLPSALFATIVNAAILVAVLWTEVYPPFLVGWLLVVLLVAWFRYAQRRIYLRIPQANDESELWGRRFLNGAALSAALWGVASFFFFTPQSLIYQVFIAFVLTGMVSGSLSTLSSSRVGHLMFLTVALLPYGVRLVGVGDAVHLAMAGMLMVYIAMIGRIGLRLYETITESLRLRFNNLDLLRDLTEVRDRQEKANQELAAQIAATSSAQDALQRSYVDMERRVEERTAELRKSEEALRNTDRRKDEFLAMLGHELRNPLAPIRNALQVMRRPDASESMLKWVREVIDRQVDHLARLVNDLLDVSRIMYGKISLQETMLEMSTVIHHAVEGSLPLIESRHQNLAVRIPKEPLWIKGDLVRLAQVISNLLNNASKYSDTGARIGLNVRGSEQWITISVQDNGIGIPAEVLPYVFDLFAQADHSLARTQGGLGIGLTLVKRLVEMHNGRVEVRSEGQGRGCEFVVHLPQQTAPARPEAQPQSNDPSAGAEERARVLIVDDNQDAVETLALLMRLEGYIVAVAHDGVTALSEAAKFQPQVVLLDIGMPGMDGYEVARELRTRESMKSMIIIALTGYGQPEDRALARAAGFTDHLTKPVDPESLNAVIKAHLQTD